MWRSIIVAVPPLLVAVILHEIAHGWAALKLGDPTAKQMGRLTLNPLKHIDPFMTIVLPALLIMSHSPVVFGGAKPVPVNALYFKNPRRGMLWVAAAGPATNFLLAALSFGGLLLVNMIFGAEALKFPLVLLWAGWFYYSIVINLVLGCFNLLPIPPLDGGRIAVGLLPLPLAKRLARVERYGIIIVVGIIYLLSKFKVL